MQERFMMAALHIKVNQSEISLSFIFLKTDSFCFVLFFTFLN